MSQGVWLTVLTPPIPSCQPTSQTQERGKYWNRTIQKTTLRFLFKFPSLSPDSFTKTAYHLFFPTVLVILVSRPQSLLWKLEMFLDRLHFSHYHFKVFFLCQVTEYLSSIRPCFAHVSVIYDVVAAWFLADQNDLWLVLVILVLELMLTIVLACISYDPTWSRAVTTKFSTFSRLSTHCYQWRL